MKRCGQIIKLKKDKMEEYKKLHADIWHEILDLTHDCNIRNYSIYLKDDFLFAYFEYVGVDFAADMKKIEENEMNQKWWSLCKPCQEPLESRVNNEWWANMEEVFHMDYSYTILNIA